MIQETIIRRPHKHEVEQAIKDLEARGFKLVYPLTEQSKEGKSYKRDFKYNRRIFVENIQSSRWIAVMRRETK